MKTAGCEREEITLTMSTMDVLYMLSEGNPGGITVMMQLLEDPDGLFYLIHLDDMNIRGSQIWIGYKDYCGQDIECFKKCIKNRDESMISMINEINQRQDVWKAVRYGAFSGKRPQFEEADDT